MGLGQTKNKNLNKKILHISKGFWLLGFLAIFISCSSKKATSNLTSQALTPDQFGTIVSEIEGNPLVVFQDPNQMYWFGGSEKGVYKYDGKKLILYTTSDGLCSHSVWGIQADKHGNIYFDTEKGVSKFNGKQFNTLTIKSGSENENKWELNTNDLWFKMGWGNLGPYRYDGTNLYALKFPKPERADSFYAQYPNVSYAPNSIYTIYKDRKGHIWFGTASLGIGRFDGKDFTWIYEDHLTHTPAGGDFGIRSIIEDKDGYFWFCNSNFRYQIKAGYTLKNETKYLNYTREKAFENNMYFMSVLENQHGDLWMGTYDDGVYRKHANKLIHYPIKIGADPLLIFSIYRDQQENIWLTSHNGGLYRLEGETFVQFKDKLQVPNAHQ